MPFQDADSSTVKIWDPLLKGMLSFKVPHYLGHNSLGAAMVIVLLLDVAPVSFTGMIIIASEGNGPLAGTVFSTLRGDWMEDVNPEKGNENQS